MKKIIKQEFTKKNLDWWGQFVLNKNDENFTDDSYLSSILKKVCYDWSRRFLVCMCDGCAFLIDEELSKQEMVDFLNENNHRLATESEVIRAMSEILKNKTRTLNNPQ